MAAIYPASSSLLFFFSPCFSDNFVVYSFWFHPPFLFQNTTLLNMSLPLKPFTLDSEQCAFTEKLNQSGPVVLLSPYGIVLRSSQFLLPEGQPFMRFVHPDDLVRLCSGFSQACKQPMMARLLRIRISFSGGDQNDYRWYEITALGYYQQRIAVSMHPVEPTVAERHTLSSWAWDRLHDVVESGVTAMTRAIVVLVQTMQEHGYQLKNIRSEVIEGLLSMLAWTGLVKDIGLARSLVDKLLDGCIDWYMDQALKRSPGLELCQLA